MSLVKIDENGKGGFACSWSIDLEIGCRNACKGCYGSKTSYMSTNYFENIKSKEYNEDKFRASCKLAYKKGVRNVRYSKHSDSSSSHLLQDFKSVLKITGEEGIRLVVVSKSIEYDDEVAELLKSGNHTLHISLGMITNAPSDMERVFVYRNYLAAGVAAKLRIVDDVTKPCKWGINDEHIGNVIITPMRYTSKAIAEEYDADLSKYTWEGGYYYAKLPVHPSWDRFKNWCGDIQNCCCCLVSEEEKK